MSKLTAETFVAKTLSLIEKEREAEINETRLLQEQVPLKELQRRGVCLLKLRISSRHTGLYGRTVLVFEPFWEGKELPSHNFTPGDIAGIHLSQGAPIPADQLCSGIVSRITTRTVSVAFDESLDQLDLDDNSQYKLIKLANDVTYRRIKKALQNLEQYNQHDNRQLVGVLFGETEPGPPYSQARDGKQQDLVFINSNLDESQQEAVKFALQQRELAIIHGPPGTGKTTTVTEIILQAIKQGLKLLVCAPSNIAVDNLTEKLSQYRPRMVRMGHPARVLPSIHGYSLDAVLHHSDEAKLVEDVRKDMDKALAKLKKTSDRGDRQRLREDMRHLRKELRTRENKAFKEVLRRMDIVLATLTMATQEGPLKHVEKGHFDLIVIDECSQAMEAACWIALQQASRCILAGDHNQLPPTILSNQAAKEGLALTLMERLLDLHGDQIMRMLTTQYRMHESIMTWPSNQLYGGRLKAHTSVASHLLCDLPGISSSDLTTTPLLLIDTAGCDLEELNLPDEVSKGNEGEADIVTTHVESLLEAGLTANNIAVIAPYNLQVELLRLRLSAKYPKLEIKSVDGFQGREKEAVIISLVRSNDKGEVGFLAEDRRMNVAITRARRHLAVVCDSDTVGRHDFLKALVEYMTEEGEVRSAQQYIQDGALDTDYTRPEYLEDQMDMLKKKPAGKTHQSGKSEHGKPAGKQQKSNTKKYTDAKNKPQKMDSTNKTTATGTGTLPETENKDIEENVNYIEKEIASFMIQETEQHLSFPPSLTARDRKLVHEICENLGLLHVSQGTGSERYIKASKPTEKYKKTEETKSSAAGNTAKGTASSTAGSASKGASTSTARTATKGAASSTTGSAAKGAASANAGSGSSRAGSGANTERFQKAKTLQQPVVKYDIDHSGTTNVSQGAEQSTLEDVSDIKPCDRCGKGIPLGNYELHRLRCKEIPTPSAAKVDSQTKSKKNKNKKHDKGKVAAAPEEDFDALIAQAVKENTSCHYPKCKNNAATLGQNCPFCAARFCLTHFIPEGHGCGDKARAQARATISREGVLYRGSGVPSKKPDPKKRVHLERKLENKLTEMADKRKIKKKEK